MFTINAGDLSAILDKVAPHRPADPDMGYLDMIVLDCTRRWLYAVAGGDRTIAIARTPVKGAHWIAPIAYDDASALRGWLESADHVSVEHRLDTGRPLLRFTEGAAQITVPVASDMADLPWRALLRAAAERPSADWGAVRLRAEDLALWEHAGEEAEVHAAGGAALVIRSGPDFIGLHMPCTRTRSGDPLEGWSASVRSRLFLYGGMPYEVGAVYADRRGARWRITARPEPGQEPVVVGADDSCVALPLSVVLAVGGPLMRLPF
ncbi:phiSA1p31-related protein [Streptomyces decoyicus]